ncbi:M50 family metallopeptidase [Marimonas arenosa]|uniref:M50 family metallopeptidase n=1 Tax=Marimonas arenosa TaxID=1795305 RepID=A0AAE4B4J3_9RHOB|nr:M50 family metallopeptidase [Marimonas arenosa]MDQ2091113.1 M50 family metallopeptidase [Marimonas arenosa]
MISGLRQIWPLLLLTAAVIALWSTPMLLPLKMLVVFFHEFSHLLTALLTGGSPEALTLTPHQGGMVLSRGGNRFLILSSGYLGSLLIGLAIFLTALSSRADRWVTAGLGGLLLLVAAFYIRDGFALAFTVTSGTVLLITASWLGHAACDLLLRLIGLTSMIYVPLDIFSDTLERADQRSDARLMAEEFGGLTIVWGILWLFLSLWVIALALRLTLSRSRRAALRG